MLSFWHSPDPFFDVIIRTTYSESGKGIVTQIYPKPSEIEMHVDPAVASLCFPVSPSKEKLEKFMFSMKNNDGIHTYGYVQQILENGQFSAYCCVSSFFDPIKILSMLNLIKDNYEDKDRMYSIINRFLHQNINGDTSLSEKLTTTNLAGDFMKLCDPYFMGMFISYLALDSRVIITSSSLSLLADYGFGILSLIFPLSWPGVFIPILPAHLIDTLLAPFPYIIGIHSSLAPKIPMTDLESHIFVNIDAKRISYNRMPDLPQKLHKLIGKFATNVKEAWPNTANVTKLARQHFLDSVAFGLDEKPDKPIGMLKKWNKLKDHPTDNEFVDLICQSQLVLNLMRTVEEDDNVSNNPIIEVYFPSLRKTKDRPPLIEVSQKLTMTQFFKPPPLIKAAPKPTSPSPAPCSTSPAPVPLTPSTTIKKVSSTPKPSITRRHQPAPLPPPDITERHWEPHNSALEEITRIAESFKARRVDIEAEIAARREERERLERERERERQLVAEARYVRRTQSAAFAARIARFEKTDK